MTLSLNTPVPYTPIFDELLAERGAPLPESDWDPSYVPVLSSLPGNLHALESAMQRFEEAADAYGEESMNIAADIERMYYQALEDLGLLPEKQPVPDELVMTGTQVMTVADVARAVEVPVEMIESKVIVGVDPTADDPEKTMVIAATATDADGHRVIFAMTAADEDDPAAPPTVYVPSDRVDEQPPIVQLHTATPVKTVDLVNSPRYQECLRFLRELSHPPLAHLTLNADGTFTANQVYDSPQAQAEFERTVAELNRNRTEIIQSAGMPFAQIGRAPLPSVEEVRQLIDQGIITHVDQVPPTLPPLPPEYAEKLSSEHVVTESPTDPAYADLEQEERQATIVDSDTPAPEAVTPEIVSDLLSLVGVTATPEQVKTWTEEQRTQAVEWAGLTHLSASDNDDIEVPLKPAFLVECTGAVTCQATSHEHGCFADTLAGTPVKFWLCPDPEHRRTGRVEWDGDLAVCMEDGCGHTNEKPHEADGE